MELRPFHLAIPVKNLEPCRTFYREVLKCEEGRSSDHWVDFNFYGHQLVIHQKESYEPQPIIKNEVDGHGVPVPHFGVVLKIEDWRALAKRLKEAGTKFIIEPYIRFEGEVGEQATMFFQDPEGNALEFKAFEDLSQLFEK
ncbi:MAG: VOC family protein [Crocinitomicaceae bacterium]|nr:VOC family protein [Crocinitomicaceae bacterium]